MTMKRLLALGLLIVTVGTAAPLLAQGQLSVQVLQLLSRVNTWIATQTFQDLRMSPAAIPSDTANRIYADVPGNLYYNGGLIAGAGGGVTPHNLLSTTHPDTLAGSPTRGAVIIGNSTPAWAAVTIGAAGTVLHSNGTDAAWSTDASGLTAIPGAQITGTIAAVSGVNLTNLNASNLASGTVPLARLSGILNAQLGPAAGITYSNLTLTGGIVNADINAAAAIAYSKLNLAGSVLTTDIAASTILFSNWATNSCVAAQVPQFNGTSWACKSLTTTDVTGVGTVSTVGLSLPAIFAVTGSPVTSAGTLTATLVSQTANFVFAAPNGGAGTPSFRALLNADLPASGVVAGSNSLVTVNAQGIVTTLAQANIVTNTTGTLSTARGGTSLTAAADDNVMVGNGTNWAAQLLPNCVTGALNYTQATNTFSCNTTPATHNILSASHGDATVAAVVAGDLLYGNATPKWDRLPKGTQGQVLSMGASLPAWVDTIAYGSLAASTPHQLTQTWNNAGVTFTGIKENITDTASAAASLLLDLQTGGTSQFSVSKSGTVNVLTGYQINSVGVLPPLVKTNTAAYAAVNNTAVETDLGTTTDLKIPAGFTGAAGHRIIVDLRGVYGVNSNADTLQLKVKACTVSGCGSGTVVTLTASHTATPAAAETNRGWTVDTVCNVFTAGGAGTLDCQGFFTYGISTVNSNGDDMPNTSTVTVDTTVDQYISATVTFNNAKADNTITLRNANIRVY